MKIVITTMIWKRPNVFRVWATAVTRIIKTFKDQEFEVLVAGSEGNKSKKLADSWGFHYLETPNQPLGLKANLRLKTCEKLNPDYVLFLGSDDLMCTDTFSFILDKMKKGFDEIAPMDLYLYKVINGMLIYSEGYINHRKGERLAIGRALHKDVLNRINWKMWSNDIKIGLDGNSRNHLDGHVKNPHYYWLKENNLMIVDLKTEVNLSKFRLRENHYVIDNTLLNKLPELELINSL